MTGMPTAATVPSPADGLLLATYTWDDVPASRSASCSWCTGWPSTAPVRPLRPGPGRGRVRGGGRRQPRPRRLGVRRGPAGQLRRRRVRRASWPTSPRTPGLTRAAPPGPAAVRLRALPGLDGHAERAAGRTGPLRRGGAQRLDHPGRPGPGAGAACPPTSPAWPPSTPASSRGPASSGSAATPPRSTPTWPTRSAGSPPRTRSSAACWPPPSAPPTRPAVRADLPLLLVSGDRDPVGGPGGANVTALADRYRAAGVTDVHAVALPGRPARAGQRDQPRRGHRRRRGMADGAPPALSRLLAPLQLRGRTLPSRVVFCAHLTNLAVDRLPSPAQTAYYAARAAGGAGLVDHRGAVGRPGRPALREGRRRHRPGRGRPVPGDRRTRCTRTAGWSSPSSTTTAGRAARCTPGCRCWRPRRWPTRCSARCPGRPPPPTWPPWSPASPGSPGTSGTAVWTASSCRPRQSSLLRAFLSPRANRRTDGCGRRPGPAAARGGRRRPGGPGPGPAARRPAGRRTNRTGRRPRTPSPPRTGWPATGAVDWLSTTVGVATESLYLVEPSMATGHRATRCRWPPGSAPPGCR